MSSPTARPPLRLAAEEGARAVESAAPVLALDLKGLSFDGRPILGAIRLDLMPGETLAVTGPSGIGKTSLLRVLSRLEKDFSGTLEAPARVAMVFQEPTLLPWRSALDNICLTTGLPADRAAARLAEVGLGALGDQYPAQLSLGQQRRLSLARAFAAQPDVLLMDEPFVSLDPGTAEEMMALFARLRAERGVATVLVTHVEAEAEKLASRIVKLDGAPARITEERQNKGAYFQLSASGVTSSKS